MCQVWVHADFISGSHGGWGETSQDWSQHKMELGVSGGVLKIDLASRNTSPFTGHGTCYLVQSCQNNGLALYMRGNPHIHVSLSWPTDISDKNTGRPVFKQRWRHIKPASRILLRRKFPSIITYVPSHFSLFMQQSSREQTGCMEKITKQNIYAVICNIWLLHLHFVVLGLWCMFLF